MSDGSGTAAGVGSVAYSASEFDALFAGSDDPWAFRTRWYEERKRALTLASLPAPRYASAYEPGCANGELTAALAPRCERLLASDGSARAVDIARRRTAALGNVEVRTAWLPDAWPDGRFDLVVVSELAYYLDAPTLGRFGQRLRASLEAGATVLACHWRRRIEGCSLNGDEVHERLAEALALPHLLRVLDADLRLDVWCGDGRSVGQREGLA